MTLGEFREQTKELSDDLVLEFYSEKYNDSTQPMRLEFDTEGYVEFVIDDDRWCLAQEPRWISVSEGLPSPVKRVLGQDLFINKPCVSTGTCEHDKNVVLDKLRAEIEQRPYGVANDSVIQVIKYERVAILEILDKYKAESEKTNR